MTELERLRNELAYYKRQVDWHAGNALRDQYALAQLSYDSSQLMKSFQLIADLQRTFSTYTTADTLYSAVLEAMLSLLETDRVVFLKSNGILMKPHLWKGFSIDEWRQWFDMEFDFFENFNFKKESILLNSKTEPSSFDRELQVIFQTPHFILTPLIKENKVWGALFTGRMNENKLMSYKSFTKSSIDIIEAIAGMISAFTLQIEKNEQMERERSRIARDMHDDVGSELSKISIACENVKKQYTSDMMLMNDLSEIQNSSTQLVNNIGNIIWALNPINNNALSLVGYLREYASDYLEMHGVSLLFEAPELSVDHLLHHETRTHLFMAFKECLHNIVKHAAATNVRIKISLEVNVFSCRIEDNGKGFTSNRNGGSGNGLRNIRQRMHEIGGDFTLSSKAGEGTIIQLSTRV